MKYYLPRMDTLKYILNGDHNNYSNESYNLINLIYDEMKCLKPFTDDEGKRIYVRYERGDYEDYIKLWDLNIKKNKEYNLEKESFLKEYYMEYDWMEVRTYKYNDYKTIIINNELIIQVLPQDERTGFEYDISSFLKDLYERIKYSISLLKNNEYYKKLCSEISYIQRKGIIKLDDYFRLNKNLKKSYYEFLSKDEIDLFLSETSKQLKFTNLVEKQAKSYKHDVKKYCEILKSMYDFLDRIETMTAKDYYDICKLCYQSINLEGAYNLESKDLFYKYADGRDCGLKKINIDDPNEFKEWVNVANDHAFEIRRGSSTSRIDLWVSKDERGFYFVLHGKYLWNSKEVIKFYVELIKKQLPVYLCDVEVIRDRLIGKGIIGIVPNNIFPRHCQTMFDNDVCDFINLPYYPSEYEKYLKYIKWDEIPNTFWEEK